MTNDLTTEERVYIKLMQLKDEIKNLIINQIAKSSEAVQRQEDATTKMIAHYEDFAKIPEKTEKVIEEKMIQCANLMADIAGKQFCELVKQDVTALKNEAISEIRDEHKTVLNNLSMGVDQATYALNDKTHVLTKTGYLVSAAICLTSLLVAFGIHYFYPRTTICKLNDNMAHAYFVGERILNNWSKLSDKEKDKILSLTITKP